jgi:hypothetical protein
VEKSNVTAEKVWVSSVTVEKVEHILSHEYTGNEALLRLTLLQTGRIQPVTFSILMQDFCVFLSLHWISHQISESVQVRFRDQPTRHRWRSQIKHCARLPYLPVQDYFGDVLRHHRGRHAVDHQALFFSQS